MGRLSAEDLSLICNLRTHKGWGSTRMIKDFPNKMWKRRAVDYLMKKIDLYGTTARKTGSGRPKSARTTENHRGRKRADLYCSHEDNAQSPKPTWDRQTNWHISRSSVEHIVRKDLALHQYKRVVGQRRSADCKVKRLQYSRQLFQRFPTAGTWKCP